MHDLSHRLRPNIKDKGDHFDEEFDFEPDRVRFEAKNENFENIEKPKDVAYFETKFENAFKVESFTEKTSSFLLEDKSNEDLEEFNGEKHVYDDSVNIGDFKFDNNSNNEGYFESDDKTEKLIIVPGILGLDEIKLENNEKDTKQSEENFSNFKFDFDVKHYIESSTYKPKEHTAVTESKKFIDDDFDTVEDIELLKGMEHENGKSYFEISTEKDKHNEYDIKKDLEDVIDTVTTYEYPEEELLPYNDTIIELNEDKLQLDNDITQETSTENIENVTVLESNTDNSKSTDMSTVSSIDDDVVEINRDLEKLEQFDLKEEEIFHSEDLEKVRQLLKNDSWMVERFVHNKTDLNQNSIETVTTLNIASTTEIDIDDVPPENLKKIEETITPDGNNNETDSSETAELFDAFEYGIMDQLYILVKKDVEINLPHLLKVQNSQINFTKTNFENLISTIHNDSLLKVEFKEYLRALVKIESENYKLDSSDVNNTYKEVDIVASTESVDSNGKEIKHFHIKKKELIVNDVMKEFSGVYKKIMYILQIHQVNLSDVGSGDYQNEDYNTGDILDKEVSDQASSEIALALPSKQDTDDDYYNFSEKTIEEETKKRNRVGLEDDISVPDRAIKTFDTPSGRVKILYQVNEKETLKKDKEKVGAEHVRVEANPATIHNAGKFLQESEKHKVSAVVTSDGKIGILVKAKPKNTDQTGDTDKFDDRSYPNPKLVPTKIAEGNEMLLKTTILRPVSSASGTEGVFGLGRTILKPVGTNIWTAHRKETEGTKPKIKSDNLGETPYDDDYYDEDDFKTDGEIDKINFKDNKFDFESTTLRNLNDVEEVPKKPNKKEDSTPINEVIDSTTEEGAKERIDDPEVRQKNAIRTFDEDFLRGLQKNTSEERKERIPDFPDIVRNPNSIDYRSNHDKSVYLNILDILGPDSRDVIQLLKDVKHINNDRSKHKKQLAVNPFGEGEKINVEDSIPILNRNPVENDRTSNPIKGFEISQKDIDERIMKSNEDFVEDRFRDRHKNRVDFQNRNPNFGDEKDWVDEGMTNKNLDDIWSDNEEELAEDSMVRIIPVHTGHSIFQKINIHKTRSDQIDSNSPPTEPSFEDIETKIQEFDIDKKFRVNNASQTGREGSKFKFVLCFCTAFGFGFYTLMTWLRFHSRFGNLVQTQW